MDLTNLRVLVTIFATMTAIIFILMSYVFPNYSVLVLTIEVILLPAIYIVGNYYVEHLLERKYNQEIDFLSVQTNQLNEKYNNQRLLNIELKAALKYYKNAKNKK